MFGIILASHVILCSNEMNSYIVFFNIKNCFSFLISLKYSSVTTPSGNLEQRTERIYFPLLHRRSEVKLKCEYEARGFLCCYFTGKARVNVSTVTAKYFSAD